MISDKLLALRKQSGMSQQDVANSIGVTRQTISNWELGQGAPTLDKAAELARLYGVEIDDLANDGVEVVASGKKRIGKDLHVLLGLVGQSVTVGLADGEGSIPRARILGASNGWVRLECAAPKTLFKSDGTPSKTIRLVSTADIAGFIVEKETL